MINKSKKPTKTIRLELVENTPAKMLSKELSNSELQNLLILSELRKNCRTPSKKIAEKINIHSSTVREKITKMEAEKRIYHTSLLDFSKTEYKIRVVLCFKAKKKIIQHFLETSKINTINTILEVNNFPKIHAKSEQSDYHIECLFKTINELADFADALEEFGAINIKEHHIITELKKEEFLADDRILSDF